MEGKLLFVYCAALVISFLGSMVAVYATMQVLKIDANTSAVGEKGHTRGYNLRKLVLFGILSPIGSAFATGFTFIDGLSLFTVLAAVFTVLQAVSVTYMATSVAEAPAIRAHNVTKLKTA